MGERYRQEMLAHGGAKEPMLMVEGNSNPFFNVPAITLQRFLSDKSDRSLLLFLKWTQLRFPVWTWTLIQTQTLIYTFNFHHF